MLEIFVCDDQQNITEFLSFFIMKHFGASCKVTAMNRCQELIGTVELKGHVPDILIMDINLRDGNGIETVSRLQTLHPNLKVIYLTGNIQYATEIFTTDPAYFLVKPIREDQLLTAIRKVSRGIESEKNDAIALRTNGSEILLYRKEILYVESRGRKVIFHMSDGKAMEIYEKMDVIQELLGSAFLRCHKSYLVHMKYITERTNLEFFLSTGQVIPISKANLREAKQKFISYLGEEI